MFCWKCFFLFLNTLVNNQRGKGTRNIVVCGTHSSWMYDLLASHVRVGGWRKVSVIILLSFWVVVFSLFSASSNKGGTGGTRAVSSGGNAGVPTDLPLWIVNRFTRFRRKFGWACGQEGSGSAARWTGSTATTIIASRRKVETWIISRIMLWSATS